MSAVIKAAAVEKKRYSPKKRLIIIEEEDLVPAHTETVPASPQPSIWMQMCRIPKVTTPIVWEGIEDISDDEDDTPQAAGRRLSQLKATRARIQFKHHMFRLEDLKDAGLFLNW
jgi:hypothetical protein